MANQVTKAVSSATSIEGPSRGFPSFDAFKRAYGAAGNALDWHHVVEQHAKNVEKFGPAAIHNTSNLIRVPRQLHREISGYYSSKQPFTDGKIIRDWLFTKSYDEQYQFGRRVLSERGIKL